MDGVLQAKIGILFGLLVLTLLAALLPLFCVWQNSKRKKKHLSMNYLKNPEEYLESGVDGRQEYLSSKSFNGWY